MASTADPDHPDEQSETSLPWSNGSPFSPEELVDRLAARLEALGADRRELEARISALDRTNVALETELRRAKEELSRLRRAVQALTGGAPVVD